MADTYITQENLERMAKSASILLKGNLVAGQMIQRQVTGVDWNNTGGTAKVTWAPIGTPTVQDQRIAANRTALVATSNAEESQSINVRTLIGERRSLSTYNSTFELNSYTEQVIKPMAAGMAVKVDDFLINRIAGGFSANEAGVATSNPTTIAQILAGREAYVNLKGPLDGNLNFLFGSATEAALLATTQYSSSDYASDAPTAIKRAMLVDKYGLKHYMSQAAGIAHDPGVTTGTPLASAGSQTGLTLTVDGFSTANRYLNRGSRITIAGLSNVYYLAADTEVAADGTASLTFTAALESSPADNAAITFAPQFRNVIFHPGGFAGAIIAPPALPGALSSTQTHDGLSVRLSVISSLDGSTGAGTDIQMEAYVGGEVLRPELGVIVGGA